MAEILSQKEIDALLFDIESGEDLSSEGKNERKKQISVYDFRHPNLVSKEQIRTLQMVHARFGKLVESYLTSKLRKLVDVKLMAVDQVTYSEFMLSVSDPSCIYILKIENLQGEAILEITLPLVFYLVDRLFGGEGNTIENIREMTLIEQHVIAKLTDNFVASLNKAWAEICTLDAEIAGYQSRPSFIQIASLEEMVISISLEVNVQEVSGFINLCFPFRLFEDVLPQLSSQEMMYQKTVHRSTNEKNLLTQRLKKASIPVVAELGRKRITISDLLGLHEGDVIRLDAELDNPLVVYVDDRPKYLAHPGVCGKNLSVQVEKTL